MILDANTVANDACLRPDVCVVGAARPASLALSLTGQDLRVLLTSERGAVRQAHEPGLSSAGQDVFASVYNENGTIRDGAERRRHSCLSLRSAHD